MKKLFLAILATALCVSMAACEGDEPTETTNNQNEQPAVTTTTKPGTTTEEPTVTECAHDYQGGNTVDATCTTKGSKTYTCSKCGDSYSEEIAMIAHAYTDATCAVPKTCSACATTEGEALGHSYKDGTCTRCNEPDPDEPALEYKLNSNGTEYYVAGLGTCTDTEIVIPNTYKGLPVTEIRSEAFNNCTELTSVIMPDSITRIGDFAFSNCSGLTEIVLPDSVKRLYAAAFSGCTNLTSITLSDNLEFIDQVAFARCTSLTSIVIPDSVIEIGESTLNPNIFDGCTNLQTIFCEWESVDDFECDGDWIGSGVHATVYWADEWEYVDGIPTAK